MVREWNDPCMEWSMKSDFLHLMAILAVCDVSLSILGPCHRSVNGP